jgi:hypothetical protein
LLYISLFSLRTCSLSFLTWQHVFAPVLYPVYACQLQVSAAIFTAAGCICCLLDGLILYICAFCYPLWTLKIDFFFLLTWHVGKHMVENLFKSEMLYSLSRLVSSRLFCSTSMHDQVAISKLSVLHLLICAFSHVNPFNYYVWDHQTKLKIH